MTDPPTGPKGAAPGTPPLALVINPAAGGGRPARYLPQVSAVLGTAGAGYAVHESTSLAHARSLACAAARRGETVVAFGGDGLVSALVDAIVQETGAGTGEDKAGQGHRCAVGIIPAGRGNDIARTLQIPFDPAAAARLLLDGRPRPVDLIEVSSTTHPAPIMAAGTVYVGIPSVAGEIANRARLIRGPAVYHLAALRAMLGWKPTSFEVETTNTDGDHATATFRGHAVVVANSPYFGAGMKVAPDACTEDGLLDVVMMRHSTRLTLVRALMKIKQGSHVALPQVSTLRASTVTVTVDRQLPAGADGELLPVRSPLRMRAIPAAVEVIAPG